MSSLSGILGYLLQLWGIYCSSDTTHTDTIVGIWGHTVTVLQSNTDLKMKIVSQFLVLGYFTD